MFNFKKLKEKKSKKVLILTPTSSNEVGTTKWLSANLGIERLTGNVKNHGHYAETFDTNFHAIINTSITLEKKLKERKWDVIGFSVLDDTIAQGIGNIILAAKLCPDSLIIARGTGAQFDYQTLLDKSPAKIVVLGEGEELWNPLRKYSYAVSDI